MGLAKLAAAVVAHAPPVQLASGVPDLLLLLTRCGGQGPVRQQHKTNILLLAACIPAVTRCVEDGYQEIKKEGAATLASLAAAVPGHLLAAHTDKLAAVLVAGLGHPHSRVRTAMLAALDSLVAADALPAGEASALRSGGTAQGLDPRPPRPLRCRSAHRGGSAWGAPRGL